MVSRPRYSSQKTKRDNVVYCNATSLQSGHCKSWKCNFTIWGPFHSNVWNYLSHWFIWNSTQSETIFYTKCCNVQRCNVTLLQYPRCNSMHWYFTHLGTVSLTCVKTSKSWIQAFYMANQGGVGVHFTEGHRDHFSEYHDNGCLNLCIQFNHSNMFE